MTKKAEQQQARRLRRTGWSLSRIADCLRVSKSSVRIWVIDIPQPEAFSPEGRAKRKLEAAKRREEKRAQKRIVKTAVRAARQRKQGSTDPYDPNRLISGAGYWMIPAPKDYVGKTYIEGRYVYEHRYLMEQRLGRLLTADEVVHHKNENKLDNRMSNLELTTQIEHAKRHAVRKTVSLNCPVCKKPFQLVGAVFRTRMKNVKSGRLCCSRACGFRHRKK